uniref:myelin-oligodendrocyte glycoprotein-like isoform X2 n=1 Tax=Scatophagus argus TaxID=75038 RepID=UPI001ED80076|nr:myelin-oligodendrocyte glycoprotein-like isoform X2 [Scatophagus argus]
MVLFGDFVLFTLWTLTVRLSTEARATGQGQPHVVGPLQPIICAVGDDVILPCHLEPPSNVEGLTVEWSKPDLKPDPLDRLSRVEYVHVYRDRHEDLDMKIQSYFRRTTLFTDGLKTGNISLKITNVTLEDEGRYRCFIPKLRSQVRDWIVQLVVEPNSVKSPTETPLHTGNLQTPPPSTETRVQVAADLLPGRSRLAVGLAVVFVFLVLGGGVGGCLLRRSSQQAKVPEKPLPPPEANGF